MVNYFNKFPRMVYNLEVQGSNSPVYLTNIMHRAKILEVLNKNVYVFYQYTIQDGETPEIIADKYYGSPQYFWVVLFSNDMLDPIYDWPLSYDNFSAVMVKNYGSLPLANSIIYQYQDPEGNVIDFATFQITPHAVAVSAYDYWFNINESKRNINLLDKQYLQQIDFELNNLLSSVQ